jgi:nitrate/nitrite transporter NarK
LFLPISLAIYTGAKKVGAGINSLLTPYVFSTTGDLRVVFWIGLAAAALCFTIDVIFSIFEWRVTRSQQQSRSNEVNLSGIFNFPKVFWLLVLHMGLFFGIFSAFFITASGMVQTRFGFTVTEAGIALVLLLLILVHYTRCYCY